MTYGQQCICIWAVTIPIHIVVGVFLILLTTPIFSFDFPFKAVFSYVWMVCIGIYVLIGPALIYNRIEDIWNRG